MEPPTHSIARSVVAVGRGLVHFPAPKTHFAKDLTLVGDTQVFATSKHALVFIKAGAIDEMETGMMAVRWRHFILQSPIPVTEQKCVPPVVIVLPISFYRTYRHDNVIIY
jgi:hypothetical protein